MIDPTPGTTCLLESTKEQARWFTIEEVYSADEILRAAERIRGRKLK